MLQFSAVLNSAFTVSQRSHIFYCYSNSSNSIISYLLKTQHYPYLFMRGGSFEAFPSLHWGKTQGGMLVFEK